MAHCFDGLCGRIAPGLCRFSMNGSLAIKTNAGYRTYDPAKKALINCDSFAFDAGDDFFFVLPTNKVKPGDIILADGRPKYVLEVKNDTITALNYEGATVEMLVPERHMFMGNMYMYGKIVSMFGGTDMKGKKGVGSIMKYMLLSSMMKNGDKQNNLLPLLMMCGKTGFMSDLDTMINEENEEE